MATEMDESRARSLLGLRPPADLAEETVSPLAPRIQTASNAAARPAADAQARSPYPVVSSGWGSEDGETRGGQWSDIVTALKAGVVALVVILAIAFLLH